MRISSIQEYLFKKTTYRQRFVVAIVLIFGLLLFPVYCLYQIQGKALERLDSQLDGIVRGRRLLDLHRKIASDYVSWASHPNTSIQLNISDYDFADKFPELSSQLSALSAEGDIKQKNEFYVSSLDLIENAIRANAYKSTLVLQEKKWNQLLVEGIYFRLPKDILFAAQLFVTSAISTETSKQSPESKAFQGLIEHFRQHIMKSKLILENAYTLLDSESGFNEALFANARQELINIYKWDTRFIESVKKNYADEVGIGETETKILALRVFRNITDAGNEAETLLMDLLTLEKKQLVNQKYAIFIPWILFSLLLGCLILFRIFSGHFLIIIDYLKSLSKGNFNQPLYVNPHEELGEFTYSLKKVATAIQQSVTTTKSQSIKIHHLLPPVKAKIQEKKHYFTFHERIIRNLNEIVKNASIAIHNLQAHSTAFAKESIKEQAASKIEIPVKFSSLHNRSQHLFDILKAAHDKVSSTYTIAGFMSNVSEQASLLSFNADIEVMNVGNHQSDFIGICNKIRNFSTTALKSSGSVNEVVEELSKTVSNAKDIADRFLKNISKSDALVSTIYSQIETLNLRDTKLTTEYQQISQLIETEVALANQMKEIAETLAKMTEEDRQTISETEQSIEELEHSLNQLSHQCQEVIAAGERR